MSIYNSRHLNCYLVEDGSTLAGAILWCCMPRLGRSQPCSSVYSLIYRRVDVLVARSMCNLEISSILKTLDLRTGDEVTRAARQKTAAESSPRVCRHRKSLLRQDGPPHLGTVVALPLSGAKVAETAHFEQVSRSSNSDLETRFASDSGAYMRRKRKRTEET